MPPTVDFHVGTIATQPGTKVSGVLHVPPGVDAATEIPITIFHGVKPGPVLALIAGNHGYEYPPILALQQLRPEIDPAELTGTIIMVHVANMPSFLGRTVYFSPIDGKNLNRVYPGKADGTVSDRIAYAMTHEILNKSDYVLDLHCGDGNESLRPYLYQTETGNAVLDAEIARLVMAFGMDHIVIDRGRPTDPEASFFCSNTAITRGKPAVTIEAGYLGGTDQESVDIIKDGVMSVLRELKMIAGEPLHVDAPMYLDPTEVLNSPATGILYPAVVKDQKVKAGELLATITGFFGNEIGVVRAPFDGIIIYVVATPPITVGQPVAFVAAVRE
ncbi:MAG: M14 family metallopeptidase [Bryobacteraceae bacterium]